MIAPKAAPLPPPTGTHVEGRFPVQSCSYVYHAVHTRRGEHTDSSSCHTIRRLVTKSLLRGLRLLLSDSSSSRHSLPTTPGRHPMQ